MAWLQQNQTAQSNQLNSNQEIQECYNSLWQIGAGRPFWKSEEGIDRPT